MLMTENWYFRSATMSARLQKRVEGRGKCVRYVFTELHPGESVRRKFLGGRFCPGRNPLSEDKVELDSA